MSTQRSGDRASLRYSVIVRATLAVLATIALPAAALAQAAPAIAHEKYTLPNDVEVILGEDHSVPIVAVNTWFKVGSGDTLAGRTVSRTCSSTSCSCCSRPPFRASGRTCRPAPSRIPSAYVLAGDDNSRLYKRLVYDMQVAQDVSALNNAQRLDGGFQSPRSRPRALARSSSWTSPDGRRCRAPR